MSGYIRAGIREGPGLDWKWGEEGGLESGGKDKAKQTNELLLRAL